MSTQRVELMLDCRATIGESPTWSAADGALFWIDVKQPALHRLAANGASRHWPMESDIGAFALLENAAGALVALRNGLFDLDFASGVSTRIVPAPFDPKLFRFNEGICDAQGRFWVGVMFDPLANGAAPPRMSCAMHRFSFADGLTAGEDSSDLHNGFAWNRNNDEFLWSHSYLKRVYRARYDLTTGAIGAPQQLAKLDLTSGIPDGAAMDEEGCYWCAVHGGSVLRRYDARGALVSQISLPVSQPTMCAFIGPNLDEMVITSARQKLSPDQLAREPHAGGLFRLRPGVRGLPRPCVVR